MRGFKDRSDAFELLKELNFRKLEPEPESDWEGTVGDKTYRAVISHRYNGLAIVVRPKPHFSPETKAKVAKPKSTMKHASEMRYRHGRDEAIARACKNLSYAVTNCQEISANYWRQILLDLDAKAHEITGRYA